MRHIQSRLPLIEKYHKVTPSCNSRFQNSLIARLGGAIQSFAQHDPGFSNPGAKYNERADQPSWADMKQFFAEILGS